MGKAFRYPNRLESGAGDDANRGILWINLSGEHFDFCMLGADRGRGEVLVLSAVVEVKVRVDDGKA